MIIYSESFHVEHEIENDWIKWVKETLVTELKSTQLFTKIVFFKVISHSDDTGNTFSIQCFLKKEKNIGDFYTHHSKNISSLIFKKFNTKVLSFKTELELLDTFDV